MAREQSASEKQMAKQSEARETLATQTEGTFSPSEFTEFLNQEAFDTVDTILLGNPEDGKIPLYIGELLTKGEPVEATIGDQRGLMSTWIFHPLRKFPSGEIRPDEKVTHVVIASYDVNANCSRILTEMSRLKQRVIVGLAWQRKIKTNAGYQLNKFRCFQKFFGELPAQPKGLPPVEAESPAEEKTE